MWTIAEMNVVLNGAVEAEFRWFGEYFRILASCPLLEVSQGLLLDQSDIDRELTKRNITASPLLNA